MHRMHARSIGHRACAGTAARRIRQRARRGADRHRDRVLQRVAQSLLHDGESGRDRDPRCQRDVPRMAAHRGRVRRVCCGRRQRGRTAGMPILRHARRRSQLAFLHGRCERMRADQAESRLDLRGDRFLDSRSRGVRHRVLSGRQPTGVSQLLSRRTEERIESPLPAGPHDARKDGGHIAARRRRHVLAADVAPGRRRRCAPPGSGDLRPQRHTGRARQGRRHQRLPERAVRGARDAISGDPVRARRPAGGVLPDGSQPDLRPRLLLAVPGAERLLPERARRGRPAAPARRIRPVADHGDIGPRHQRGLWHGEIPADLPRQRVRQFRGHPDPRDAVLGDGRLPQHGQQRQARRRRQPQRELRARTAAALLAGRLGAEPRRHATEGRVRQPDSLVRPGHRRGLRARLHRVDVSAAAGRPAAHAQPEEFPGRDGRRAGQSRHACEIAAAERNLAARRPGDGDGSRRWPSATSSTTRTSARSSAGN